MADVISKSKEDYLESIYSIIGRQKVARPKDIAAALGVSAPSVTKALKILHEDGFINYAPFDLVTLTDEGEKTARDISRRHETLRDFLVKVLAVEEKKADEAACAMEHVIPADVIERFVKYVGFVENCPRCGDSWVKSFGSSCTGNLAVQNCEKCLSHCMDELHEKKKGKNRRSSHVILTDMKPGDKGWIQKISSGAKSRMLSHIGMKEGALIEVESVADSGENIDIKVNGYHLSFREEEAKRIIVDVV